MVKRAFAPGVLVIALLMGFAGCGLFQSTANIDWVNFVRFGGITYLASFNAGRELQPADLGHSSPLSALASKATCMTPNYQTQDGDAAFLDAGTAVYRVRATRPPSASPPIRMGSSRSSRLIPIHTQRPAPIYWISAGRCSPSS